MKRSRLTNAAIASAGVVVLASAAVAVGLPAQAATAGCSVSYAVSSSGEAGSVPTCRSPTWVIR